MKLFYVFVCVSMSVTANVFSADKFFDNDAGDELFGTVVNWSDDALPDARTVIAGGLTSRVLTAESFSGFGDLSVGGTLDGPAGTGHLIVDGELLVNGGGGEAIIGANNRVGILDLNDGAIMTVTNFMRVGRNGGGGGQLNVADALLTVGHDLNVSNGGGTNNFSSGTVRQTSGMLIVTNAGSNLNIAQANNADGTFNLEGGSVHIRQHLNLGNLGSGSGNLNVSGTGELNAGDNLQFRRGTVDISGGLVRSGELSSGADVNIGIDENSDVMVKVSGGRLESSDQVLIGRAGTNSIAMLAVESGEVIAGRNVHIRSGNMVISNGLVQTGSSNPAGDFVLGVTNDNVKAYVDLYGGEIRSTDNVNIRNGTYSQYGGSLNGGIATNIADIVVGADPGAEGIFQVFGGTVATPDNLNFGNGAGTGLGIGLQDGGEVSVGRLLNVINGTVVQSNGVMRLATRTTANSGLAIGSGVGYLGTYKIFDGTLDSANFINLGSTSANGDGFLEVHGGRVVSTNSLSVRKGQLIVTGGEIKSAATLFIASSNNQEGELNMSGGTIISDNQITIGQTSSNGTGRITMTGGLVNTISHFQFRRGSFDMTAGELVVGRNFNVAIEDGSAAQFVYEGGDIVVSNAFTVGRNAGGGSGMMTTIGAGGSITVGATFAVRTNAFLDTVFGPDGVALIETLNDGADIGLNNGSTWDVSLAGGVYVSDSTSNLVFRAKDSVFQGLTSFNETLWNRVLGGATGNVEPRTLHLTLAGAADGVLSVGGSLSLPGMNSGWVQLDNLPGGTIKLVADVTVTGGATINELVQSMVDAGYSAEVVDSDTFSMSVAPAGSTAFFSYDFSDFDAANGTTTSLDQMAIEGASEQPRLTIEGISANVRRLSFDSVSGDTYQVEIRESLISGDWADEGNQISGTGGTIDILQTNGVPAALYRLRLVSP